MVEAKEKWGYGEGQIVGGEASNDERACAGKSYLRRILFAGAQWNLQNYWKLQLNDEDIYKYS